MTEPKHTPGPWTVQGPFELASGGEALAISADGIDVALVTYNEPDAEGKEACRADARLIAAAPNFFDLAVSMLKAHPARGNSDCKQCVTARAAAALLEEIQPGIVAEIDREIAKARGES